MNLKSVLLYAVISTAALDAGTVISPEIFVPFGPLTPGVTLSATNISVGNGYMVTQTTACFDGQCPSLGAISTSFTVNDPLTLRVTQTTITCTNPVVACGLGGMDWGFLFTLPASSTFSLTFALDGTAPANFGGLSALGEQSGASNPLQPITVNGSGNFSQSLNLGTATVSTYKAVLLLQINGLGAGQSINLPNSMTMAFNPTPEPTTLAVGALGIVALGALAVRRRRKA